MSGERDGEGGGWAYVALDGSETTLVGVFLDAGRAHAELARYCLEAFGVTEVPSWCSVERVRVGLSTIDHEEDLYARTCLADEVGAGGEMGSRVDGEVGADGEMGSCGGSPVGADGALGDRSGSMVGEVSQRSGGGAVGSGSSMVGEVTQWGGGGDTRSGQCPAKEMPNDDKRCHKCGRVWPDVSVMNDGDDAMGPTVCLDCYSPEGTAEPGRAPKGEAVRALEDYAAGTETQIGAISRIAAAIDSMRARTGLVTALVNAHRVAVAGEQAIVEGVVMRREDHPAEKRPETAEADPIVVALQEEVLTLRARVDVARAETLAGACATLRALAKEYEDDDDLDSLVVGRCIAKLQETDEKGEVTK